MWLACVLQAQRQPAQTLVVLINGLNDMLHSFLMYNLFCLIFLFSFVFILYFEKRILALSPVYVWCIGCVSSLGASLDCSRSSFHGSADFDCGDFVLGVTALDFIVQQSRKGRNLRRTPHCYFPVTDFNDMWQWLLRLIIGIYI